MPKNVASAPSSSNRTSSGYSVPRPGGTKPYGGGGKAVSNRHVDKFNPDVKVMQRRMRAAGIDPGPIDGKKGPLTRAAMAKYESQFGKSAADGLKVDPSFAEIQGGDSRLTVLRGAPSQVGLPGSTRGTAGTPGNAPGASTGAARGATGAAPGAPIAPPPAGPTMRFHATGYGPINTRMEGGKYDAQGKLIVTVEEARCTGKPATVAVDPRYVKLGTMFYSPQLGVYLKATDTGGAIKGANRMDVAISANQKTVDAFGHKTLELQRVN